MRYFRSPFVLLARLYRAQEETSRSTAPRHRSRHGCSDVAKPEQSNRHNTPTHRTAIVHPSLYDPSQLTLTRGKGRLRQKKKRLGKHRPKTKCCGALQTGYKCPLRVVHTSCIHIRHMYVYILQDRTYAIRRCYELSSRSTTTNRVFELSRRSSSRRRPQRTPNEACRRGLVFFYGGISLDKRSSAVPQQFCSDFSLKRRRR